MAPPSSKAAAQRSPRPSAPSQRSGAQPAVGPQTLPAVPLKLHQQLLDAFKAAFPDLLNPNTVRENLLPTLQEVKSHLFNRDFHAAFAKDEYLEAYAARWSASRALGYLPILKEVFDLLPKGKLSPVAATDNQQRPPGADKYLNVLCLGGGAGAEIVALAGLHRLLASSQSIRDFSVRSIDSAEWEDTLRTLKASTTAGSAPLSSPASLALNVHTFDLLDESNKRFLQAIVGMTDIITVMFTLNELYSTSIAATQTLLLDVTRWTRSRKGTLLCVVDSPGSYSEVSLGAKSEGQEESTQKTKKKYPMQWLLDHALLHSAKEIESPDGDDEGPWEKLVSEESRWFRLPDHLDYPIDLENMRFQMHVYRRV